MRAFLIILGLIASAAQAQVFRCITPDGKTLYSDSACPPGGKAADISSEIGACTNAQCREEAQRRSAAAQQRLRQDKEELASMTAQRREAEAEALAQRIRLEELQRLTAIDQRLAAEAEAAAQPGVSHPAYPWYPVAPCVGPCLRPPSIPRPQPHQHPERRREPAVSLRDFEPKAR